MKLSVRRICVVSDEQREEAGRIADQSLFRVATVAVVENPFQRGYVENIQPLVDGSVAVAEEMVGAAMKAFGDREVQSYGKGALVGLFGEQEHGNAMLTTAFAEPFRKAIGGGTAWISSFTKTCAPGTPIDVPMNHIADVYVRSHYDGMSLAIPGAPKADEIAVIFCLANRGRLNARVGGLTHDEAVGRRADRTVVA